MDRIYSATEIGNAFLEKSQESTDMTPMKLLKLVYIAHGWTLALCDRALIREKVYAWRYGPVVPELYNTIKSYRANSIPSEFLSGYKVDLDSQAKSIVEQVYDLYSVFDGATLSAMTHTKETPWHKVWQFKGQSIISNGAIHAYYKKLSNHGKQ